jgi:UPF0716 protein FxsA
MTPVFGFLFVAFIVVPVLEIYLITQVAGQLGWVETIFLVIAVSVAGAWLVRREGLNVIRRIQAALGSATIPTNELADGGMIFFASALMLTPGFLTDALGLALLLPPVRAVFRPSLIAFFRRRIVVRTSGVAGGGFGQGTSRFGRTVYDAEGSPRPADADLTDLTDLTDSDERRPELD